MALLKVNHPTELVGHCKKTKWKSKSMNSQCLNGSILRQHFHFKTFEEIASRMSGAKFFSI